MAASFDEVRDALAYIPADLPREDWWKIAAALKNEFSEAGFDLFDQWSQGVDNYKPADTRATWKSTKSHGGIAIGTLFKMAQEYGYQPRRQAHTATKRRSRPVQSGKASGAAQTYWDRAEDCTSHPYAERQGLNISEDGLKKHKGRLLIPAYNAAGKMSTLQEIDKDGDKKFLKGEPAAGCRYTFPGDETIVVAEGWATAKSIHLATGHTAIVCFSSGQFKNVAALVRKKYPEARIILAPDNDASQAAVKYATLAARENQCEIIVPDLEDGSDFNDLHQVAGLDEVRRQFAGNVEKPRLHDLVLVNAADVTPEQTEWLWPNKYPLGKLVLLGGQPSTGKTTISHSIIAIVSTGGKWPFSQERATQGRCIILTAEDDLADTVLPRLLAAGADLSRVSVIDSVGGDRPKSFLLAQDLHQLDGLLQTQPDTRLIAFDPLSAYLGAQDSHRESDVRQVLGPVAQLAARHRVCILGIAHLNKNEAHSAMARFMGSTGIIASARAAYLTARIDGHLMMLPVKNNLARHEDATGLTYSIIGSTVAGGIETSTIEWTGETDLWANEALAQEAAAVRAPKLLEAKEFLADQLAAGPKLQTEIETAAREQDIAWRTVRRAAQELGHESHKDGFSGGWKYYTATQWKNYQDVLHQQKAKAAKSVGHLREPEVKVPNPQQQEYGHLRGKIPTSTPPKPAPDKALREGGQGIPENVEVDQAKAGEKPAESAKVAKSSVLGNLHSGDSWGAV